MVKIIDTDKNFKQIHKLLQYIDKTTIEAGYKENTESAVRDDDLSNVEIATIHEYGMGLVKARPFIRPILKKQNNYLEIIKNGIFDSIKSKNNKIFSQVIKKTGQQMASDIRYNIRHLPRDLSIHTILAKGHNKPLWLTGQLYKHADYFVNK